MSEALVEVTDLYKSFPTEEGRVEVLQGVDLSIAKGERIAILGRSGVGKTTLLYVLGGLDHPTHGTVRFRGEDLFSKEGEDLARFRNACLGFVFQFHHLLPEFSAVENVMMPGLIGGLSFDEMRDRASRILTDVGLGQRLEQRVGKLSGGERQRVAVARALVLDPPLVLADEPTGNLDAATGEQIEDLFLEINRNRATALVVVTHNEALAEKLGRRIVLVNGAVESA